MEQIIVSLNPEQVDLDTIIGGYLFEKANIQKGNNIKLVLPVMFLEDFLVDLCRQYNLDPYYYMETLEKSHISSLEVNPKRSFSLSVYQKYQEQFDDDDAKLALLAGYCKVHLNYNMEDWEIIKGIYETQKIDFDRIKRDFMIETSLSDLSRAAFTNFRRQNHVAWSHIRLMQTAMHPYEIAEMLEIMGDYRKCNHLESFFLFVDDFSLLTTDIYKINEHGMNFMNAGKLLSCNEIEKLIKQESAFPSKIYQIKK